MIRNQLTIAEVGSLLGVRPWTLRRLEALGRIPPPRRDALCHRRVYSLEDVDTLRAVLAGLGHERAPHP